MNDLYEELFRKPSMADLKEQLERDIAIARERSERERRNSTVVVNTKAMRKIEDAENELAFNREQRERLFELLNIEELERDASIRGSDTWQRHHRKVITLENQIHTIQKRIDRAKATLADARSTIKNE